MNVTNIVIFVAVFALIGTVVYFVMQNKPNTGNTGNMAVQANVVGTQLFTLRTTNNCLCPCRVAGTDCKPLSQWGNIPPCIGTECFY